jgi:hypothetical protein
MSMLVCEVKHRLPVAVVTLAGTLDAYSMTRASVCLRDCLAEQPAALVVDADHVTVEGDRPVTWFQTLASTAQRWPGTPLLVGGGPTAWSGTGISTFATAVDAIEAASTMPVPARRRVNMEPVPTSPAQARAFVTEACGDWQMARLARLASLLVSELVSNSVVHARTPLSVLVRHITGGIDVSVFDDDPRLLDEPSGVDEVGAGLELVTALADSWGCMSTVEGKVVWARILLPDATPAPQLLD